jgi:hypothetical protein
MKGACWISNIGSEILTPKQLLVKWSKCLDGCIRLRVQLPHTKKSKALFANPKPTFLAPNHPGLRMDQY